MMMMMRVVQADTSAFDGFINNLAEDVEDWFGPMAKEPGYHRAMSKNIDRGSALVAVDGEGQVVGGLLFSPQRAQPTRMGWLVVSAARRSEGIGQLLIADALRRWETYSRGERGHLRTRPPGFTLAALLRAARLRASGGR